MTDQFEYAGFWRRLAAMVLDILVISAFIMILEYARPMMMYFFRGHVPSTLVFVYVFFVIYNVYWHGRWGQTWGKMAMQIRVVKLSGVAISYRESYRRFSVDICCMVLKVLTFPIIMWYLTTFEPDMSPADSSEFLCRFQPVIYVTRIWELWILSELVILLFNEKKRGAHDYIAGTMVICEKSNKVIRSFSDLLAWIRK